jgi:hypothetical protein
MRFKQYQLHIMARIAKSGLEYFPFDIDSFQDIRIRKLIKRQSGKAVTVYALLLCMIYKDGYYMQWDEELPFICSELSGFDEAYISEVINTCLALGLFHKELFETEHVLTSKGIQTRYCNIQRMNKRMSRIDRYSLITTERKTSAPEQKEPQPQAQPIVTPKPELPRVEVAASNNNQKWLEEFFGDGKKENLMLLCKNFGLGPDDIQQLHTLADAVISEWELSNTLHQSYSDWSRHLISTMRIKNRDAKISVTSKNNSNNQQPTSSDYTFNGGFGGMDV